MGAYATESASLQVSELRQGGPSARPAALRHAADARESVDGMKEWSVF